MGGMQGFGAVVVPGSDAVSHAPWELRVFALSTVVGVEGLGAGSGRAIREEMEPARYLAASYYERWLWSTEQRLLRKGTITGVELESWVTRFRHGESAPRRVDPEKARRVVAATVEGAPLAPAPEHKFEVGETVRVRRMRPSGHTRCPRYVRGVVGRVEAVHGVDRLPDPGPGEGALEPVYAVAFDSSALFGDSDEGRWTVIVDLWEPYLEEAA